MSQQRQAAGSALETQDALRPETIAAVQRWLEAYIRRDLDAVMAATTHDCIVDLPFPSPDGRRVEGHDAVRAHWEKVFGSFPTVFETEEMFAAGDRCVFRWVRRWVDKDGKPRHIRGIDVFRVRDGKLAEKLVYGKGGSVEWGVESLP